MTTELVVVTDERGIEIYFVDFRGPQGSLMDSRWFATRGEAEVYRFDHERGGER